MFIPSAHKCQFAHLHPSRRHCTSSHKQYPSTQKIPVIRDPRNKCTGHFACLIIFLFINEISLLLIRVSYESLLVFLLLLLLLQRAYLHTLWKCSTCNSAARLAIATFTQSLCAFTDFFLFFLFGCGAKPH